MYNQITNPINNKKYSVHSKIGKKLILNYIKVYKYHKQNGGAIASPVEQIQDKDCKLRNEDNVGLCNANDWRQYLTKNKYQINKKKKIKDFYLQYQICLKVIITMKNLLMKIKILKKK